MGGSFVLLSTLPVSLPLSESDSLPDPDPLLLDSDPLLLDSDPLSDPESLSSESLHSELSSCFSRAIAVAATTAPPAAPTAAAVVGFIPSLTWIG